MVAAPVPAISFLLFLPRFLCLANCPFYEEVIELLTFLDRRDKPAWSCATACPCFSVGTLGDNPFQTHLTGMLEDGQPAIVFKVFV